MPRIVKPSHPGYNGSVEYSCDNCGKTAWEKKTHFERYKNHFCSKFCYAEYRKNKMPFTEQNAYKGVRKQGDSKQVYHRNYCKKNPGNISHLKARRYARERNAEGSHTLRQWEDLKIKHKGKCAKCGADKKLTKDHIIPLSKGGTDNIENIQPLCRNCNSQKWSKIERQHPELLTPNL